MEKIEEENTLVNVVEVSKRFKVSRMTIYSWINKGMPVNEDGTYDAKNIYKWLRDFKKRTVNGLTKYTSPRKLKRDQAVLAAVESGMSKVDTARTFDLSTPTVVKIIERAKKDRDLVDKYRENRAAIQVLGQAKRYEKQELVLDSITEEAIKKAGLEAKIKLLGVLGVDKQREFEMERLERGESTENIAVIVEAIREAKRIREERDRDEG